MTSAMEEALAAVSTPLSVRPLTGVEDLLVFYGLTKTYKRYARDAPSTYEHLISHIPGPQLYTHSANSTQPTPITDKSTLLLPLSYPPVLPPPLQLRAIPQQQVDSVLTFTVAGELGVVREEMRGRAERVRWMEEERSRRKVDKRSKKGDRKRKQAGDGTPESDEGKRLKLDGGSAMIDIS